MDNEEYKRLTEAVKHLRLSRVIAREEAEWLQERIDTLAKEEESNTLKKGQAKKEQV